MSKYCEPCGKELDIDEQIARDAVCRECIDWWEKGNIENLKFISRDR